MIFLDYNSTTPVDAAVEAAMRHWQTQSFGNPNSAEHCFGWAANEAIARAEFQVASAIGTTSHQIRFRGSSTDAIATAVRLFAGYRDWGKKKIVTGAAEHSSILSTCAQIARVTDIELVVLPVDQLGRLSVEEVVAALDSKKTCLLAVSLANSEIGTIHRQMEFKACAQCAGATVLCDMSQCAGGMEIAVESLGVDFAVYSAHKIYGPKGIGALFIAGDEMRRRYDSEGYSFGTPNVAGIVGFGLACQVAASLRDEEAARLSDLRDRLERGVTDRIPRCWVNGDRTHRIHNTTNIGIKDVDARALIRYLGDIAISTSSACSTNSAEPSHVLTAIGLSRHDARSCVRFSLGRYTTLEEVERVVERIERAALALRTNTLPAPVELTQRGRPVPN